MKQYQNWRGLGVSGLLLIALIGCAVEEQQATGPTQPAQPSINAAIPTQARPTPTFVPVNGAVAPTGAPVSGTVVTTGVPTSGTVVTTGGQTVRLEDDAWQGSYRRASGQTIYGGRSATWIYGTGTQYSTMQAQFQVSGQPVGTAELRVEGMDSEGSAKTQIQITINGQAIFNGANPLPDDDQPLDSGTWNTARWPFSATLLRSGLNEIRVENLSPGQFSRPPFFMLDYAEISYQSQ